MKWYRSVVSALKYLLRKNRGKFKWNKFWIDTYFAKYKVSNDKKVLNCAIYFWISFAQNYFPFEERNKKSLLHAYYDDYHIYWRLIASFEILKS